jgi:hypothetical protein
MMQKKILLGIVAPMVFAASGHAAMAQLGSTTSAPPPDDNRPNRSAQPAAPAAATTPADVLRAAACVTNAGPAITRAIVDAAPKSPEERRAAVAFLREGERCLHMTTSLVTSLAIIRGAAAESLLEAQFAAPIAARTPPVGAKPMTRPPPARPASPATPAAPGAAPAAPPPDPEVPYSLSECVAPARQDLVRALLATAPQSPEEAAGHERPQSGLWRLSGGGNPAARRHARLPQPACRGALSLVGGPAGRAGLALGGSARARGAGDDPDTGDDAGRDPWSLSLISKEKC